MGQLLSIRKASRIPVEKLPSQEPDQTHTVAAPGTSAIETRTLHIANALQSSLELPKLMEILSEEIATSVPHQGFTYLNTEDHIEIRSGQNGRHACTYSIMLLDKSLGQLTLTRNDKFSDAEVEILDKLVCALIYPLRNALLYKRALETALKDPVTGINNRAALNTTIEREVNLAQRHGSAFAVIMLDIDSFKKVNDSYGHLAGDAVLRAIAECITHCVRGSDIVFRYGGEEFSVVLSNTHVDGASLLANRIRGAVERLRIQYDCIEIGVTASLGVAALEHGDDGIGLLKKADQALYEAKQRGRNRVVCHAN